MAKLAHSAVTQPPPVVIESGLRSPFLAASVIVRTPEKISGQSTHAAIVTQVVEQDLVNVMVFPGDGEPFPIKQIRHVSNVGQNSLGWSWPTRT